MLEHLAWLLEGSAGQVVASAAAGFRIEIGLTFL